MMFCISRIVLLSGPLHCISKQNFGYIMYRCYQLIYENQNMHSSLSPVSLVDVHWSLGGTIT